MLYLYNQMMLHKYKRMRYLMDINQFYQLFIGIFRSYSAFKMLVSWCGQNPPGKCLGAIRYCCAARQTTTSTITCAATTITVALTATRPLSSA
jgi:hypothetical protein